MAAQHSEAGVRQAAEAPSSWMSAADPIISPVASFFEAYGWYVVGQLLLVSDVSLSKRGFSACDVSLAGRPFEAVCGECMAFT